MQTAASGQAAPSVAFRRASAICARTSAGRSGQAATRRARRVKDGSFVISDSAGAAGLVVILRFDARISPRAARRAAPGAARVVRRSRFLRDFAGAWRFDSPRLHSNPREGQALCASPMARHRDSRPHAAGGAESNALNEVLGVDGRQRSEFIMGMNARSPKKCGPRRL